MATMVYASFWRRKAAYAIDSMIVIGLWLLALWAFGGSAMAQSTADIDRLREAGLLSDSTSQLLSVLLSMQPSGTGAAAFSLPSLDYILRALTLLLVVSCLYNIVFVATRWQATPGKYWLGLRIIRKDGGHVGLLRSTARHAATGITMGVLSGLGYLTMAFRADKAALHDLICGTRVVRL
jgi:uncharacterized RDD family membrane protein YckC